MLVCALHVYHFSKFSSYVGVFGNMYYKNMGALGSSMGSAAKVAITEYF